MRVKKFSYFLQLLIDYLACLLGVISATLIFFAEAFVSILQILCTAIIMLLFVIPFCFPLATLAIITFIGLTSLVLI